jgi:hypothetical protein
MAGIPEPSPSPPTPPVITTGLSGPNTVILVTSDNKGIYVWDGEQNASTQGSACLNDPNCRAKFPPLIDPDSDPAASTPCHVSPDLPPGLVTSFLVPVFNPSVPGMIAYQGVCAVGPSPGQSRILHTYSGDTGPGQRNGVCIEINGYQMHLVGSDGTVLPCAPAQAPQTSSAPSTTTPPVTAAAPPTTPSSPSPSCDPTDPTCNGSGGCSPSDPTCSGSGSGGCSPSDPACSGGTTMSIHSQGRSTGRSR